jgi:hypothetical protein
LGSKVVVGVFSARFPGAGQAMGLPVIPSPRSGGMKRFAGTVGSGSINGSDLAGFGGHDLGDPQPAESGVCSRCAR